MTISKLLERIGLIAAGSVIIGWIGLYNGYPILAADSAGYIASAFHGTVEARRPSFYPFFVGLLSGQQTLWTVIAFQCLLISGTLYALVSRLLSKWHAVTFFLVVLASAFLTPLPWFASRLMPDVFAGILGILVYLLVLAPGQPASRLGRGAMLAALALGMACHVANVIVVVGGLLLGLIGRWLLGGPLKPVLQPAVAVLVVAIAVTLSVCGLNWQANGAFALTTESHAWTMARLVRFGVVQRLLDERCDVTDYALCQHRNRLSTAPDHFIFAPDSPLHDLGGVDASRERLGPIIDDANRHYAGMQAVSALRAALEQFRMVHLGMGLGSHNQPGLTGPPAAIRTYLPAEYSAYSASRQRAGTLQVPDFNAIIVPVAWISIAGTVGLLAIGLFRRDDPLSGFASFALMWTVSNAAVMGILNAPFDRYQSRVVWLMPVVLVIAACRAASRSRRAAVVVEGTVR